jgi:hypothetical protein
MLVNGGAAVLVGLPLLALLASPLLDGLAPPVAIGIALLLAILGTSAVSGSAWGRWGVIPGTRSSRARGIAMFVVSNTLAVAVALIVGWNWHAVHDWYEDLAGPVEPPERSWKTSGIEFDAFTGADELSIDELSERVDVRRIVLQLPVDDLEACRRTIWETFANNPHERSFNRVPLTASNRQQYWNALSDALVHRAAQLGAATEPLRTFLEELGGAKHGFRLPVAAYLLRAGDGEAWVILCKWEYCNMRSDGPCYVTHLHIWAIDAVSGQLIAESRCM